MKDEIRQGELERLGVSFLRFDALLIVSKVESVLQEIESWIMDYESKNGVIEGMRALAVFEITLGSRTSG